MQKMMSPKTTIVWVPVSGVVDPDNPTADELDAGVNISCAIVRGYTLNPTASDTDTTASICDESNVDNRGAANYEGSITFFRDDNREDVVSVFNKAWALFRRAGARGYLYRRLGEKSATAFAIGQEVEGFFVESDSPQSIDGADGGGPIQFTVPFLQQGHHTGMVYVGPLPTPTVTSSSPAASGTLGGVVVEITGTGFYNIISVVVGGVPVADEDVTRLSTTKLQIVTPANTAGSKTVVVTTAGGASTAGGAITYS